MYQDGTFSLEKGADRKRANSSQQVTPNDSFDGKKRSIKIENEHSQTLEDDKQEPASSDREQLMKSTYAGKLDNNPWTRKMAEVEEKHEELIESSQ